MIQSVVFHVQNRLSMILTKELRYGNKVLTREGEVITVQQILSNSIIYDTQIEVSGEPVNLMGSRNTGYVAQLSEVVKEADCQEIEPIALTPDLLKNADSGISCAKNGSSASATAILILNLRIIA